MMMKGTGFSAGICGSDEHMAPAHEKDGRHFTDQG